MGPKVVEDVFPEFVRRPLLVLEQVVEGHCKVSLTQICACKVPKRPGNGYFLGLIQTRIPFCHSQGSHG